MTTPTTEPDLLFTGDTWAWQRTLADYPASAGWVLHYILMSAAAKIAITGAASGDAHAISVTAATSAAYAAGEYAWQAYVTKAAERYTVGSGKVTVRAGLTSTSTIADQRSQAQIALDAATSAAAAYTASNGMAAEYEIAGRRMKFRSIDEIRKLVNFWAAEVQKELDAENIRRGMGTSRKIYTRFGT